MKRQGHQELSAVACKEIALGVQHLRTMTILRCTLVLGALLVVSACASNAPHKIPRTVDGPVVTCDACAFDVTAEMLTVDGFNDGTELDQIRWGKCDSGPVNPTPLGETISVADKSIATSVTVPGAPTDCQCACVRAQYDDEAAWTASFDTTAVQAGTDCSTLSELDCSAPDTASKAP